MSSSMTRYAILTIILSLAIISLLLASTVSAAVNAPLTTSEWVHFTLWKLEANGLTGQIFASSRPFEREEIALIVADMKERIQDGRLSPLPHELELINKLWAEFARDLRPEGLEARGLVAGEANYHNEWDSPSASFWGAASFHPTPSFTLYEEVDIRKGREVIGKEGKTASKRTNTWRWDYTADFRKAYIRFQNHRLEVLLGREPLFWGPGYGGSLIVSDNSPAFDMVLLQARFGPVKAIAFSAMLDKMWHEEPRRYLASRYLSGHRIDWIVSDRIELGLSELILYGGEARDMELQYINPLLPYYANQWNSDLDDNVLVSADFAVRPVDRLKIYGQFLVDDYNYTDHDPHALGYIAGLYLSDSLGIPGTDFRAEYTRIDTWTYTHLEQENQFTHFGWVIGHHLGPDADQIFVELSQMINVDTRFKVTYAFERQGSRTVADRFRGEDYKRMKFPSGAVEQQHSIGLQLLWEPLRGPRVNVSWQRVFTRNQHTTAPKSGSSITAGFLVGFAK